MGAVLLVAAERQEFAGLLQHLEGPAVLKWPIDYCCAARKGKRRWILAANGPGKALARLSVEEIAKRESVEIVISTGYCGALDSALRAGDVVEAERVLDGDSGEVYVPDAPCRSAEARRGGFVTVDRVLTAAAEKLALRARSGAVAVDMESAAVARAARERSLGFRCVRVVTDAAGEDLCMDFNIVRDTEGRFSRWAIARQVARRPALALPLAALARRCRMAGRKLGDYLARCDF